MIIAQQKYKENIAEYLLYMYQVEDMIRANGLDLDSIDQTLIKKFEVPYGVKREMREWYRDLIDRMREENKEESGHLAFLEMIVDEMHQLHQRILGQGIDTIYKQIFVRARPNIEALRMKSGHGKLNDIQVAFNGLYGLLILRLKKSRITDETSKAFDTIKELIAELSSRYMQEQVK